MTKRPKNRKIASQSSSSSWPRSPPSSKSKPRLDRRERQIRRFYEPLTLLYTLGTTRGEHSLIAAPSDEDIIDLPLKSIRRKFLCELSYMCDFDKGGDTVTAIALEFTPQNHIFWVASNSCPKRKIAPFLKALLGKLKHNNTSREDIFMQCIRFATPRIKKYKSLLKLRLRKCLDYLSKSVLPSQSELVQWLEQWTSENSPVDLCRLAYKERKSNSMQTLARLGAEPSYKSNNDAIHNAFRLVRHYIGRLGHHIRAVDVLLSCAARLPDLLHDFEVRTVENPTKSNVPPPDGMTTLESMIVRMLPSQSPDLSRYKQALVEMDMKYNLSDRFLHTYTDIKPRVHAEVQLLEHFYSNKLVFASDDRFIACSKAACFCCKLYFRHHPGHFEEPGSHQKIYLNWSPPDVALGNQIGQKVEQDILNSMINDIRGDALQQLDEKLGPRAWHPDSVTGITASVVQNLMLESSQESEELFSGVEDVPKSPSVSLTRSESATSTHSLDSTSRPSSAESSNISVVCKTTEATLGSYLSEFEIQDSSSDSEGGILIDQ